MKVLIVSNEREKEKEHYSATAKPVRQKLMHHQELHACLRGCRKMSKNGDAPLCPVVFVLYVTIIHHDTEVYDFIRSGEDFSLGPSM